MARNEGAVDADRDVRAAVYTPTASDRSGVSGRTRDAAARDRAANQQNVTDTKRGMR